MLKYPTHGNNVGCEILTEVIIIVIFLVQMYLVDNHRLFHN